MLTNNLSTKLRMAIKRINPYKALTMKNLRTTEMPVIMIQLLMIIKWPSLKLRLITSMVESQLLMIIKYLLHKCLFFKYTMSTLMIKSKHSMVMQFRMSTIKLI